MTHKDLVQIAHRWVLKNASCGVAFKEFVSNNNTGEQPDVIGFGSWGHSVLIEVKISRSDFLCDKHKKFRKEPHTGMGTRRYYCCPTGLIKKEELPEGWGLIYVSEKGKAIAVHQPQRKVENGLYGGVEWIKHEKNANAEMALMYSALRRLQIRGRIDECYQPLEEFETSQNSPTE